jgi:hypothetical protein
LEPGDKDCTARPAVITGPAFNGAAATAILE